MRRRCRRAACSTRWCGQSSCNRPRGRRLCHKGYWDVYQELRMSAESATRSSEIEKCPHCGPFMRLILWSWDHGTGQLPQLSSFMVYSYEDREACRAQPSGERIATTRMARVIATITIRYSGGLADEEPNRNHANPPAPRAF